MEILDFEKEYINKVKEINKRKKSKISHINNGMYAK